MARAICEVCLKGDLVVSGLRQVSPCPVCFPKEPQNGSPLRDDNPTLECIKCNKSMVYDDVPFPGFKGEDTIFVDPCHSCFPNAFRDYK